MLESTNHASIVFICGGNAGIDLLALVVGQFVDKFEPRAAIAAWRSRSLPQPRALATKSKTLAGSNRPPLEARPT